MSDQLTPQQLLTVPGTEPGASALDLDQIQGDVLIGLQKFFERFIFFEITDVKAFKSALRDELVSRVTTTSTVYARKFQLQDHNNQKERDVLPNIGLNVGFTQSGIGKLIPGANLNDTSFVAGAAARAGSLGDPLSGQVPANWLPAFRSSEIDGVFLITAGTQAAVDSEAAAVLGILGAAVSVLHDETGNVRSDADKGHEHFGWLDGISQPGIKGLTAPFPGQRLLDPGHFVFGYSGQPVPPSVPWVKNGSFMVIRRLQQLVPEFDQFLLDQAASLGMDPVLLGARLVGRWKSGAPLALAGSNDDSALGADPQRNNNFDYSTDQAQRLCPFGAHIRKTNPRQDLAPEETAVDPRRIIRAGIPFGPEVSVVERTAGKSQQQRGLMFVCYQTSIPNQFEFLQIAWANNPGFIFGKKHPDGSAVTVGWDPIIGQNSTSGQTRARTMDEPVPNDPTGDARSTLHQPQDFVIPTGGAYFFVPSIAAMENELSA